MRRKGHRRIEQLIADLGCLDQRVALRAEGRLIRIGVPALEALMSATASANARVRFRAVWALGQIGDPRALPVVLDLTDDPDARVAYDAAAVLWELKGATYAAGNAELVL